MTSRSDEGRRLRDRRGTSISGRQEATSRPDEERMPKLFPDQTSRGWGGETPIPQTSRSQDVKREIASSTSEVDLNMSLSAFQANTHPKIMSRSTRCWTSRMPKGRKSTPDCITEQDTRRAANSVSTETRRAEIVNGSFRRSVRTI